MENNGFPGKGGAEGAGLPPGQPDYAGESDAVEGKHVAHDGEGEPSAEPLREGDQQQKNGEIGGAPGAGDGQAPQTGGPGDGGGGAREGQMKGGGDAGDEQGGHRGGHRQEGAERRGIGHQVSGESKVSRMV